MTKQTTSTTAPQASILSTLAPEVIAVMTPEQIAAIANIAAPAAMDAAPAPAPAPEAPQPIDPSAWITYRAADGWHMGKAKTAPADAQDIAQHATQGKALQALNAAKRAAEATPEAPAPVAEAPAPAPAPEPVVKTVEERLRSAIAQCSTDPAGFPLDQERIDRTVKRNAALIEHAPNASRDLITNKLLQVIEAGFPYAALYPNRKYQLDAVRLVTGSKGCGRDEAFLACQTSAGRKVSKRLIKASAKAKAARAAGKEPAPKPKIPAHTWYWSPSHGGQLYVRGVLGTYNPDKD